MHSRRYILGEKQEEKNNEEKEQQYVPKITSL